MISLSCKCITYGRVSFLEEAIESFLKQEYKGKKELVIINDYPLQKLIYNHPEIRIINCKKTFNTIGEKENFAVNHCKYNNIVVWDDDDIALPNHLNNINKYFKGYDLLHWQRGIAMVSHKIAAIGSVGNSGIVYTKNIYEKIGGHPLENAGYDMTFVLTIKKFGGKVKLASPDDDKVSWVYNWGNGSYHMSGMGSDKGRNDNVLKRHARHIEDLRKNGVIPIGDIVLNPHWKRDYVQMLKDYIKK